MNMQQVNQTLAELHAQMGPLVIKQVEIEEMIISIKDRIVAATNIGSENNYRKMLKEKVEELAWLKDAMKDNRRREVEALRNKQALLEMEITCDISLDHTEKEDRRLLMSEIGAKVNALQNRISA